MNPAVRHLRLEVFSKNWPLDQEIEVWLNDLVENARRKPATAKEADSPEALRRHKDSGKLGVMIPRGDL